MNHTLLEIFSYSVGIGALLGIWRIRAIDPAYYPFVALLTIAIMNEVITTVVLRYHRSNALNNNIYVLIESLLIAWQFYNWKLFQHRTRFFVFVLILFVATWLIDNFWVSSITRFSSYFGVVYSFVTVLMSISMINRMLMNDSGHLLRNACFLVCMGFLVFFAYKTLIEVFWIYGINESSVFRRKVYRIMTYINLAVNLIYAYAVLWIPVKRRYMWHS